MVSLSRFGSGISTFFAVVMVVVVVAVTALLWWCSASSSLKSASSPHRTGVYQSSAARAAVKTRANTDVDSGPDDGITAFPSGDVLATEATATSTEFKRRSLIE